MIDIKRLDEYSRFLNLKQICDSAGVSYSNVKHKVQRQKAGRRTKLNEREVVNLSERLKSIGVSFQQLEPIKQ